MEQEAALNRFLEEAPVGTLMKKYSIPCIISLLVAALYNIVDQIFIANADYLGSYGNAANTVVFPLTVVALAIAVMIGDGCCAFVSIALGRKDAESTHKSVGSSVVLTICAGIVLMVIYLVFSDVILTFFGGRVNDETFSLAKEYFFWITVGVPFYMFGQTMNPIIRSDGNPQFAMISTLAGAALNIILDPTFIYGLHWGMMGAAVATVAGQILTAALAVWYMTRMKMMKLRKTSFRPNLKLIGSFLPLGLCSFFSQISLVIAMAAVNSMIMKYSLLDPVFGDPALTQIPMAVLGIVMKFFQIVISIVVGMAAGCIPVVGFNIGAGRADRVKQLFLRLLVSEALVGAAAFIIVEFFPAQVMALFGAQNESPYYMDFALKTFRIYLSMIVFACVNKAAFIFLQAMGRPWVSTFLSMLREIIFGSFLPILLPMFFGLNGILYSMPAADLLTMIASVIVIVSTMKKLNGMIAAKNSAAEA